MIIFVLLEIWLASKSIPVNLQDKVRYWMVSDHTMLGCFVFRVFGGSLVIFSSTF